MDPEALGRAVCGELEGAAYERAARDHELTDSEDGHPGGLWFDEDAAARVLEFFEGGERFPGLVHFKGEWAGQTFELQPWQRFVLSEIFGWKREDGTRRYRTAFLEVPRKNGKTTLAAGIGLYMLAADGEPGAEVYSSATKKDQAKIAWGAAHEMVKRTPELNGLITKRRNTLSIPDRASKFEPLGADADTLEGLSAHCNLVDEVQAHKDRQVYDVLDDSMGARQQPLTVMITTAGVYKPESFGYQEHEYAANVLRGAFQPQDETYFAFIAHADEEEDDWSEPETWEKANPNLGVSLKREKVREKAEKAERQTSYLNNFLRQYLNVWTEQKDRWISMDDWEECAGVVAEEELGGRECYGGLDLASTRDLTALVLAFPPESEDERWKLVCRFWVPEETIVERAEVDRVPYPAWARDGWIHKTPGNVTDYEEIETEILELADRYDIQELGYDRWNAQQMAINLQREGLEMVEVSQRTSGMSEPSKAFERLVLSGDVNHGCNPVLKWNVANVSIWEDTAGNIRPHKGNSKDRIDGVVAAIMAVGRATLHEEEENTAAPNIVVL